MVNVKEITKNPIIQKYSKMGIIAIAAVVVAIVGIWAISGVSKHVTVSKALSGSNTEAAIASDLRMAVIRMDAIQTEAKALKDLRKQRDTYEKKLHDMLNTEQKRLEKEKTDIEKSQDVLSRDALQRRVVDYQNQVNKLQRDLTERAQSIETSYQKALADIQAKHLDPLIEGLISKKKLSLVIDGRMARIGQGVEKLDITKDVIQALDKKVSSFKMGTPKGF